jgi:hypothetical protein
VIRDLLPPYAAGLASEATQTLVESHLQACADCTAALGALQDSPINAIPLEDGVLRRIKRRLNRKRVLAGAGAAVGVLLLVWLAAYVPIPLKIYAQDIKEIELVRHVDEASGANEAWLELRHQNFYRSSNWYDSTFVHPDGSVTVVHLEAPERPLLYPIYTALYKRQFLEHMREIPNPCVFGFRVPQQTLANGVQAPYPTEKIIFQLYTFNYYNAFRMRSLLKRIGDTDLIFDENGQLRSEVAKLCTLVWEGKAEDAIQAIDAE